MPAGRQNPHSLLYPRNPAQCLPSVNYSNPQMRLREGWLETLMSGATYAAIPGRMTLTPRPLAHFDGGSLPRWTLFVFPHWPSTDIAHCWRDTGHKPGLDGVPLLFTFSSSLPSSPLLAFPRWPLCSHVPLSFPTMEPCLVALQVSMDARTHQFPNS